MGIWQGKGRHPDGPSVEATGGAEKGGIFGQKRQGHDGHFLIRLSENWHLGNRYAPENFEHMAEKISLRYVEIRGLFGFRCT